MTGPPPPRIPRREPWELPTAKQCCVCRQLEDEERTLETQQMDRLVGHAAWAICPACGQEAPDLDDPDYRGRALRYVGVRES